MYYDLNIAWPARPGIVANSAGAGNSKKQQQQSQQQKCKQPAKHGVELLSDEERQELERSVKMAAKLGYSTIAFNVVLQPETYDSSTVASYNPCFNAHPVFPELDSRTVDPSSGVQGVLQLSRITVMLDENSISGGKGNGSMFTSSNANAIAGYNLIAAQPLDSASFTHTCLNLSSPGPSSVDIITLDLATSARLPFQLKRSMVLKAVADGVMFEVCYGITMRSSATAEKGGSVVPKDARRNVIAGARELIRITNGKGIILSSQVKHCMEMRAPLDLCNFGTIIGLKPEQSKATVSDNARLAVIRGYAHRGTYRGVICNPVIVTKAKDAEQQGQQDTTKGKRKRSAADDEGR